MRKAATVAEKTPVCVGRARLHVEYNLGLKSCRMIRTNTNTPSVFCLQLSLFSLSDFSTCEKYNPKILSGGSLHLASPIGPGSLR